MTNTVNQLSPEVKKLIEDHIGEMEQNKFNHLIYDAIKLGRETFFELRDALVTTTEDWGIKFDENIIAILFRSTCIADLLK